MLEFYVTGQSLKMFSPVVAADSLEYLTARFNFIGGDWDGSSRWAHFRQGDTVYDIELDGEGRIKAEAGLNLTAGEWEIYLTGTRGDSRLTTVSVMLTVRQSGLIDAPLHSIPKSVAEQIDYKASAALLTAQAVKAAADRGEFKGKSFTVAGRYESLEELTQAVSLPAAGDAYAVGAEPPYDIYLWDGRGEGWINNGPLTAVRGERGEAGAVFTPSLSEGGNLSWSNDGLLPNPQTVNIMGPRGERGLPGENGQSPYQAAAAAGYTGTEQTFNTALTAFPYHNARHLPDGVDPIRVQTGNLENRAVTTAKLAEAAVTEEKIAGGAVSADFVFSVGTDWVGESAPYTQEIELLGLRASDKPTADVLLSENLQTALEQLEAWGHIYRMACFDDLLCVYAQEPTERAISVQLKAVRK